MYRLSRKRAHHIGTKEKPHHEVVPARRESEAAYRLVRGYGQQCIHARRVPKASGVTSEAFLAVVGGLAGGTATGLSTHCGR